MCQHHLQLSQGQHNISSGLYRSLDRLQAFIKNVLVYNYLIGWFHNMQGLRGAARHASAAPRLDMLPLCCIENDAIGIVIVIADLQLHGNCVIMYELEGRYSNLKLRQSTPPRNVSDHSISKELNHHALCTIVLHDQNVYYVPLICVNSLYGWAIGSGFSTRYSRRLKFTCSMGTGTSADFRAVKQRKNWVCRCSRGCR